MSSLALESLAANVGNLSAKDKEFASSLLSQAQSRELSPKQMHWVNVLNERAVGVKPEARGEEVGDMAGILGLFNKAKESGLTRIALLMQTASGQTLRLTMARDGGVNVKTRGSFEEATYFGKVTTAGKFQPHHSTQQPTDLLTALKELAANPTEVARAYGRKTGACCCCGRELTNHESIELGIGPICADKWGL